MARLPKRTSAVWILLAESQGPQKRVCYFDLGFGLSDPRKTATACDFESCCFESVARLPKRTSDVWNLWAESQGPKKRVCYFDFGLEAPERRQLLVILKAAALNLWPDSQKERLPFGICWQSLKARINASATLISVSGFQAPERRQLLVILKAAALNLWPDSQKERLLFGICWQSLKAPKNASATLISVWKPLKDGSCL